MDLAMGWTTYDSEAGPVPAYRAKPAVVTEPATLFDGGPVAPTTAIAVGRVAPGAEPEGWAWLEMKSGSGLVKFDAMCRAIAAAKSVDEIKKIHDTASAMAAAARVAKNKDTAADQQVKIVGEQATKPR